MQINSRNRNRLFWLLQIAGWGMVNSTIFIVPYDFSITYIIYSFFGASIAGIVATSLYRAVFLKKIESIWEKKSIIKVIGGFFMTAVLYYLLAYFSEIFYDSIWGKTPAEIKFDEEQVTWAVSIFSIAITILAWMVIYFTIKFLLKSNQNRLESLELNATLREAQLNTLKGQVNPHFMFNSLNNIRGLMLEDVDKSREMITKLSEMLQFALKKNTVDAIPLEEELEMVENYIALSKIQMEERLQFVKEIEASTLGISIPPMIMQLLVENAAKHGISRLKTGGTIRLQTKKVNNELNIIVSNTGKLSIAKESTQLGLKNIKQRLRLLYGENPGFSLEEVDGEVVAKIKIPLS